MEIVSLINYLQLPVNCLPSAPVMQSGNHQSLAVSNWLLSSAGGLGFWFANQSIRQSLLLLLSGLEVGKYSMIMVEGKITAWGTPHLPSCLEELAINTIEVKQEGLVSPLFPDRIISAWYCPRCLGNVLLCSYSKLMLNSHFMQFERWR